MRLRIFTIAAGFALASVSAFAQNGQSNFSISVQRASEHAADQAGQTSGEAVRRLSIDEAVKLALEQNLGIRIQRLDPQVQDTGVQLARSFWAPTLTSGVSRQLQTQQSTSALSGNLTSLDNTNLQTQVGLSQTLPWGGNYTAGWNSARSTTNNQISNFPLQLNSSVNFQYTQPLLRNFDVDQIRQQVSLAKKTRELSDIQLTGVVTSTLRAVRNAYWDLSYAIANLKTQQQSLALSQQSLKDNQKRVEIGTMAPIDIVQAQAEVASNTQGVIIAEAAIKTAQDNLRTLILDPGTPDFWTATFEPTDAPAFNEQAIDVEGAVRTALEKRSDLLGAKNLIEQSDVNVKYYANQIKPDVNAQATFNSTFTGGTQLENVNFANLSASRAVVASNGFGTVLGNVLSSQYPTWTFGVQVGYPLGANTAHANLARVKLEYEQAQQQLKSMQMQVVTQVRLAARNVNTNQQRVASARASRELQEKKLEAEEKKMAAGMGQSFFVFQAQRDLALARTAEILAISDYNKSLVDFEAVQQVPLNGGTGQIQVAR